jgi:hypothetical protein
MDNCEMDDQVVEDNDAIVFAHTLIESVKNLAKIIAAISEAFSEVKVFEVDYEGHHVDFVNIHDGKIVESSMQNVVFEKSGLSEYDIVDLQFAKYYGFRGFNRLVDETVFSRIDEFERSKIVE